MADLNTIKEGTVDDAKSQLSGLTSQELEDLRKAEKDGKNRSTLIEAIDDERLSREEQANIDEGKDRPTGSDGTPVKQAGDSVNRDSAQNVDDGRKARLETMGKASDDL